MAIRLNFIKYFTYLLYFYFSENAKVRRMVRRKNETFNNVKQINHMHLRSFNVK